MSLKKQLSKIQKKLLEITADRNGWPEFTKRPGICIPIDEHTPAGNGLSGEVRLSQDTLYVYTGTEWKAVPLGEF